MTESCHYFKFVLFVTGKGEEKYLPKLFSQLSESGICSFQVGAKIGQLRPRSEKKIIKMVGKGQAIPNKDFDKISSPARRYLTDDPCNRIILIDDLEGISTKDAQKTFERYRTALDIALPEEKKQYVSVHFLVNMFEAYFFSDLNLLQKSLEIAMPDDLNVDDVEAIPNPKSLLKKIFPDYKETKHPDQILDRLNLEIILADLSHCTSLRTCVKWVVAQLATYPDTSYLQALEFEKRFHLEDGKLYPITSHQ